jgi:hypothetical protein
MEGFALLPLLLGVAVQVGIVFALYAWGRWVAKRQGGVWWRRAVALPLVAMGSGLLGVAITCVLLVRSFSALERVTPSHKAEMLSRAIADAMMSTALLGGLSMLLYLASVVVFTVGSLRAPRTE